MNPTCERNRSWYSILRRTGRTVIIAGALWLACLALSAFMLQHEHVGEYSYFTLFIPYENLHFQLQDSVYVSKTEIDLYLLDENDKVLYHDLDTFSIQISDNSVIRQFAYPVIIRLDAIDCGIQGHLKLTNLLQGTRKSEKFSMKPPSEPLFQTTPLYIFQDSENRFVTKFPFNGEFADSITIIQHYSVIPDSVHVMVEDIAVWKSDQLAQDLDITLPVEDRIYNGIDIRTFLGTRFISSHDREPFYSLYDSRYTPKEQIRQLEIIMLSADIHLARSAKDDEVKEFVSDYWKRNDPTPETEYNENRELFISRVLEADKRYSLKGFIPGWKTDQGKILIKYGEPEYVYEESFPTDTLYPYIIWYYYSYDKRFVFYDKKGFGYYELDQKWYIDRD